MRRYSLHLLKLLALVPLMGMYSTASCQADTLRKVAEDLDDRANNIDDRDPTLGDILSDLVEDL